MRRILQTGWLRHNGLKGQRRVLPYTIRYLDEAHLPCMMALQDTVAQFLGRPDLLHCFSYDFMKQHVGSRGFVLGVFVKSRLAAFRNVYYPDSRDREWNLGMDLRLPEEALTQVANLQMVCVHPWFRGNSLALRMNRISLGLLRANGTCRHIFATVSPYNIWNLPVLLRSGFHIVHLKSKYGGKMRYIVYQDLRKPSLFDESSAVRLPLNDLDSQCKLLGAGYCGVALQRNADIHRGDHGGGFELIFKALLESRPISCDPSMSSWLQDSQPASPI